MSKSQEVNIALNLEDRVLEPSVGCSFIRLNFETVVGAFDFSQNTLNLAHVFFGSFQLALRLFDAHLVFGDSGRFLKKVAPIFGFGGKDLVDFALLHDGVSGFSDARIPEKFLYFFEFC